MDLLRERTSPASQDSGGEKGQCHERQRGRGDPIHSAWRTPSALGCQGRPGREQHQTAAARRHARQGTQLARARTRSLSEHTHTHTHTHTRTHTHTHTHTHKHTHKVDGYDVRGLSPTELPQWIMGEEGSVVTLSFEGANVRYDTSVVRGAVPAPDMTTHPCVALPRRSSAVRRAR